MPIHIESPTKIKAEGFPPKLIQEFFGHINSDHLDLSIAVMTSPAGWSEPGQRPEFDEYTVVLSGCPRVETESESMDILSGQAVHCRAGEWIRYSSPSDEGAHYVAICRPAFSPDTVNRDSD